MKFLHEIKASLRLKKDPTRLYWERSKVSKEADQIIEGLDSKVKKRSSDVKISFEDETGGTYQYSATSGNSNYIVKVQVLSEDEDASVWGSDLKVSCSCPYWRYSGPEYHASSGNYLLGDPRGTASKPDVRDEEGNNKICKHVYKVLQELK